MWRLELLSNKEELDHFEEREDIKINGPPLYFHFCDPDEEDWSNMSDPRQAYSDNESFDLGADYNSDF